MNKLAGEQNGMYSGERWSRIDTYVHEEKLALIRLVLYFIVIPFGMGKVESRWNVKSLRLA